MSEYNSNLNTINRLMWACAKLAKADTHTIKILKDSTISNVRAIERNSRSIKDPNPLMSTMTNINLKYPITYRAGSINEKEVPEGLILNRKDYRRYNRKLCKTDLVQWYIYDQLDEQKIDENSAINALMETNLKRLRLVFDYPWSEVKFKIGNVSLSRTLVSVNPNTLNIPKELIKPTILLALGLSNIIEYNDIPDYYLRQIREIINESNLDVRKLPNLLNYIQSQIDDKKRFLPILPGLNSDFIYISHALVQPQYRVTQIMENTSRDRGNNLDITNLCISLIYHCQKNSIGYPSIRSFIKSITVHDYPLIKILAGTDENKFTRFIKGCLGMEIIPKVEIEGIKFYPKAKKIFETTHLSLEGVEFKRINGEETVHFESAISKGFFVHNADALLSITINRTSMKELAFVLANIAVFMTSRFEMTRGKTVKQLRYNCKRYFQKRFYEFVGVDEKNVKYIKMGIESTSEDDMEIGALRLSNHVEIETSISEVGFINGNDIKGKITGQTLCTAPTCNQLPILSRSIKISEPQLYYLMHPINLLKKAIQYNINVIGVIRKKISEGKFESFFPTILNFIPVSIQDKVSTGLKKVLHQKVLNGSRDNLFLAVFYNFCIGNAIETRMEPMLTIPYHQSKIDLRLAKHLLVKDPANNLLCDGEIIIVSSRVKISGEESYCSILPHFTIKKVPSLIEGIPTKTVEWLNKNVNNLDEGFKAITIFQTNFFLVQKKNDSSLLVLKTLQRHLDIGIEEDTSVNFSNYLLKRKIDEVESSSSSGTKRARIETASSTY